MDFGDKEKKKGEKRELEFTRDMRRHLLGTKTSKGVYQD